MANKKKNTFASPNIDCCAATLRPRQLSHRMDYYQGCLSMSCEGHWFCDWFVKLFCLEFLGSSYLENLKLYFYLQKILSKNLPVRGWGQELVQVCPAMNMCSLQDLRPNQCEVLGPVMAPKPHSSKFAGPPMQCTINNTDIQVSKLFRDQ